MSNKTKSKILVIILVAVMILITSCVLSRPTGFVVSNLTEINATNDSALPVAVIDNSTVDSGNNTPDANIKNEQNYSNDNISKSIGIVLSYKSGTPYNTNDNGIEPTKGIIDLTVEDTKFGWVADQTRLCTRWTSYSDDGAATSQCYGSEKCCSFIGLLPKRDNWNDVFYSSYGQYGTSLNNIISAQVLYVDYNTSPTGPFSEIYYSKVMNLSANFYFENIDFKNVCVDTCSLSGFNQTSYNLIFELENATLNLDTLTYTIANEVQKVTFNLTIKDNVGMDSGTFKLYKNNTPISKQLIEPDYYNIEVKPNIDLIDSLVIENANITKSITTSIGIDNISRQIGISNVDVKKRYALNLGNLEFEKATLTATASANSLYKCKQWDYERELCFGAWERIKDLTPGMTYSLTLTKDDPGFIEGNLNSTTAENASLSIPNLTIGLNSNLTINLSSYFNVDDSTVFTYYNPGNITIIFDQDLATIVPDKGFVGIVYTFITANISGTSTISNLFSIKIANILENVTPRVNIEKKDFKMDEDVNFDFEYLSKSDLIKQNRWKDEYEVYEKTTQKTKSEIESLKQKVSRGEKQKGKWQSSNELISASIFDFHNNPRSADFEFEELRDGKFKIKLAKQRDFKAGRYTIRLDLEKGGVKYSQEQNFTWGVLAINVNKSIYIPEEDSFIGIAVLDDNGKMVCNANVTLEITSPSNKKTLATDDGSIKTSPECPVYGVTNLPDYYTNYSVSEAGTYIMNLTASTSNGIRSINDSFDVRNKVAFDVARLGPTRIYPPVPYTMNFTISANENYNGPVMEYVPAGFGIAPQNGMITSIINDTEVITWNLNIKNGRTYNIGYEFDAPDISPEFYILGPLEIGAFKEARNWQIASDALSATVLSTPNVNNTFNLTNSTFSFKMTCTPTQSANPTCTNYYNFSTSATCASGYSVIPTNNGTNILSIPISNQTSGSCAATSQTVSAINPGTVWLRCNTNSTALNFNSPQCVKINITDIGTPNINSNNFSINNGTLSVSNAKNINLTANVTDNFNLSMCMFVDNQSLSGGAKTFFNKSVNGRSDQCSQNYTIALSTGNVINFTVIVNDSSNNVNQSQIIVNVIEQNLPIVNTTFNITSPIVNDMINFSGNITDDTALQSANITYNISGSVAFINFTLSGKSASISNVTQLNCAETCVINFTMFATDTSNNVNQNSTLLKVNDLTPPVVNASINIMSPGDGDIVNITGNFSDMGSLSFCQFIENQSLPSGAYQFINKTATGTSGQCSQNYTINLSAGGVINFTIKANDTSNNINQSTLIVTVGTELHLNGCANLTKSNQVYSLISDVASPHTCFIMKNSSITIDCHGFEINYSQSKAGYAINISSQNNTFVRSCSIFQARIATPNTNSPAIYIYNNSDNNVIFNTSIATYGDNSYGMAIYDFSDNNSFYSGSITTSGTTAHGVEINPANDPVQLTSIYNSSIRVGLDCSCAAFAVDMHTSPVSYTRIYGNNISTYRTSVTLQNGAHNNFIYNNNITSKASTPGIELYTTNHNQVYNNNISVGTIGSLAGSNNAEGIIVRGNSGPNYATNNSIYSNTIATYSANDWGIWLDGDVYNNSIYDNNITTNDSTAAYGIFLNDEVTNNSFFRNTISSRGAGIVINGTDDPNGAAGGDGASGAFGNTFTNDTITPCTSACDAKYQDILIKGGAYDNIFTNVSMNKSRISIVRSSAAKNNMTVRWYVDINVTNSTDNNGIGFAQVVVNDSFKNNIFNATTDATGWITKTLTVTEFTMNGSLGSAWTASNDSCYQLKTTLTTENLTCFSPYNISINVSGYNPSNVSVDINRSKFMNLSMNVFSKTGTLLVNISLPSNNTQVTANTTFTLTANITCTNGNCGVVSGLAMYNDSTSSAANKSISITSGATPLFVNGSLTIMKSYDFAAVVYPSPITQSNATYGYFSTPLKFRLESETEFSSGSNGIQNNYTNISNLDDVFAIQSFSTPNLRYATHKFTFKINETISQIQNITVYWNGTGGSNGNTVTVAATLFIWNSSDWEILGTCSSSGTDPSTHPGCMVNKTISTNILNYVNESDNNAVYILAKSNSNSALTPQQNSIIRTNYIQLNITSISTNMARNPVSCGNMVNGQQCQLNWTINASGDIGSQLAVDVNFSSDNVNVVSNSTEDRIVTIIPKPGALLVNISLPLNNTQVTANTTFTLTANITCTNGNCGAVSGLARYNDSTSNTSNKSISITSGATPLFVNGSSSTAIKSYDFGGVTYPSPVTMSNATFGYHRSTVPNFINLTNETEFGHNDWSSTFAVGNNYTNISSLDNVYAGFNIAGSSQFAAHKFTFKINESESSVTSLTIFYNGTGGQGSITPNVDMNLSIWNGNAWEVLGNCTIPGQNPPSTPGCVINKTISANVANYIDSTNNNAVYILALSMKPAATFSYIRTNFIQLNVTTSGGSGSNPISCGSMVSGQQCQLNWTINASGDIGSQLAVDVNFTSDNTNVATNNTENRLITIAATTNNNNPTIVINNITTSLGSSQFSVDPISSSYTNVLISFNVTDADGISQINASKALVNLTLGSNEWYFNNSADTTSELGTCFNGTMTNTVIMINCTVVIPYYANASGNWRINITVPDTQGGIGRNDSGIFTINIVSGLALPYTAINFSNAGFGQQNVLAYPNLLLNNTGNDDFSRVNISGSALVGTTTPTDSVGITNFGINTTNSSTNNRKSFPSNGIITLDDAITGTFTSLIHGHTSSLINKDKGNISVFMWVNIPNSGLSSQLYNATWNVTATSTP